MADKKKIAELSALVGGAILFMAWLAGLLHFGKIVPGRYFRRKYFSTMLRVR